MDILAFVLTLCFFDKYSSITTAITGVSITEMMEYPLATSIVINVAMAVAIVIMAIKLKNAGKNNQNHITEMNESINLLVYRLHTRREKSGIIDDLKESKAAVDKELREVRAENKNLATRLRTFSIAVLAFLILFMVINTLRSIKQKAVGVFKNDK